ncbi:MAG: hypothetical protein V3V78_02085 [Candidatus Woesearchaeota archaeon]
MVQKRSNKKRYNFLIDASVYEDFSLLCEEIGLVRSKNIENKMKSFIEENKELLRKLKGK